jgi:hypothetical protein
MTEVTRILSAIDTGDPHAAAQLLPLVYDEAEPHLLAGYNGLKEHIDQMPEEVRGPRLGQATEWLVELYTVLGKAEEAANWRAERAKHRAKHPAAAPPPPEKK